jgi:hypothetical protein
MVPRSILRQLSRLRRREALLRLAWGAARCLALVFVLVAAACLVDWTIDRYRETPLALRAAMLAVEAVAAAGAVLLFLALPLLRRPGYTELALRVEEKVPALGHRLISAVQLNQPGAFTQGMSPQLIARVTAEAEARAAQIRFPHIADHRRLKWSLALVLPVLLIGGAALLAWPDTVTALLSRQLLSERDIPRSVHLVATMPSVWYRPNGEEVVLRFQASGEGADENLPGEVRLEPEDRPAEHYPLKAEKVLGPGKVEYTARIPPSAVDFTYRAWLADGRMPHEQEVRYAPRPVVTEQVAWVLLPAYVGLRPKSKTPYEQEQPRAEIVGLKGGSARVRIRVQKPVRQATVELLGTSAPGKGEEAVLRRIALKLEDDGRAAVGTFNLRPEESAYRVVVQDEHGFDNVPPPRRGIRIVAEEPPQVTLLREEFRPVGRLARLAGPSSEFEVEGMPVPPGGRIRIAYTCTGPYGLGLARLRFRVLKKKEADSAAEPPPTTESWLTLPLIEVQGSKEAGPFDPVRGVFLHSGDDDQVQFHAVPSLDPERLLGRTQGGGRFDFSTRGIPDGKGGYIDLNPGDELEYFLEVFADRDPNAGRPSARSEIRRKAVVTVTDLVRWLDDTLQEERRIRQLAARQHGVFDEE